MRFDKRLPYLMGLSPLTILLYPIRTLKWIVTFVPALNAMRRDIFARAVEVERELGLR